MAKRLYEDVADPALLGRCKDCNKPTPEYRCHKCKTKWLEKWESAGGDAGDGDKTEEYNVHMPGWHARG